MLAAPWRSERCNEKEGKWVPISFLSCSLSPLSLHMSKRYKGRPSHRWEQKGGARARGVDVPDAGGGGAACFCLMRGTKEVMWDAKRGRVEEESAPTAPPPAPSPAPAPAPAAAPFEADLRADFSPDLSGDLGAAQPGGPGVRRDRERVEAAARGVCEDSRALVSRTDSRGDNNTAPDPCGLES